MGETLQGRGHTSPKTLRKKDSDDQHVGLPATIMEFIRPRCLWMMKKNKRKQLQQKEKQQQMLKKTSQVTLQEWILASPCLNKGGCDDGSGDHTPVFKQFSNRVYPSLDVNHEGFISKPRESFSMEDSSLSRSQSEKTKKKVSFRLPEVADIFILNSPYVYFEE